MTPRSASLRVAHQASCPNATKSSLESLTGCRCTPSYFTFHRGRDGKPVKSPRVRDRQKADRALKVLLGEIAGDRLGLSRPRNDKPFREWAAQYLEIIEAHGRRNSTVRAYQPTIAYANAEFGALALRDIGNPELRRFVAAIRDNGGGDATVSKHLRHLGAIFTAAVDDDLIQGNPVPRFKKALRLRVVGGVEPFTDAELARLWASMESLGTDTVYVTTCKAAVVTGARQGELIAANLDDVDLLNGTLRIERHYDRESGTFTAPKDNEPRTVHLIAPARQLLESWIALHGDRPGGAPLFPAPRGVERLNGQYLTRVVASAMEKATPPIPKVGENGRARKPFHAFRATFDRLCRERGLDPQWVQAELGHSDPRLTLQTYGAWSEVAKRAEANRVELEGFPV